MKRPLYLRQIAAPPRIGGGVPRLTPPRLLFRPGPRAPGLTVIEERANDPQPPHRLAARPGVPFAARPTPEPIPALPELPGRASRLPGSRVPHPVRQSGPPVTAARVPYPQPASTGPRLQNPIQGAAEHLGMPRGVVRSGLPLQSPPPVADAPLAAPPVIGKRAPDEPAGPRAAASRRETQGAPRGKSTAPLDLLSPDLPRGVAPPIPNLPARPTLAPVIQQAAPAVRPRSPEPPPVITPLVPPVPLPPTPVADRASPTVRIGTLEIRVVAPAAAPVPVALLPAHPRARSVSRLASNGTSANANRLARGYGAFGLSQA